MGGVDVDLNSTEPKLLNTNFITINLDADEVQAIKAVSADEKRKERVLDEIDVNDDSEEDITSTVGEKDLSASGR